ncbi:hypothetical protein CLV30_12850 [Haloactinopolyspora alba]|uniref:ParG protein n=1 Tax=Haloactinopolyspora alba TaxID=648780 RepID=A0A2P8DF26_9ACTN|nr:hypothetical protein [Haloactinopolyspora alba]PSK95798.1 hypothetical protein CLV30_12850 [Haloactinopolyspora alba]
MGEGSDQGDGRPAEPPRQTRALNINITAELHKRAGRYRVDTGVTLTAQVEEALAEWLTRKGY